MVFFRVGFSDGNWATVGLNPVWGLSDSAKQINGLNEKIERGPIVVFFLTNGGQKSGHIAAIASVSQLIRRFQPEEFLEEATLWDIEGSNTLNITQHFGWRVQLENLVSVHDYGLLSYAKLIKLNGQHIGPSTVFIPRKASLRRHLERVVDLYAPFLE